MKKLTTAAAILGLAATAGALADRIFITTADITYGSALYKQDLRWMRKLAPRVRIIPKDRSYKTTYSLMVYRVSLLHWLVGRAYHAYDANPLIIKIGRKVERFEQRILGDVETPFTARQDLRCYDLNFGQRTFLGFIDLTEDQYRKLRSKKMAELDQRSES